MNIIDKITKSQIRTDLPTFQVGDTVRVNYKIIEGKRERIQAFEGFVIKEKTAVNYDSLNWIFDGEFYGWAGSIGQKNNFDSIRFKIKSASDSTITKVTVRLRENSHQGTILYEDVLSININPSTEKDLSWSIGETVLNDGITNYFFEKKQHI